MVVEAGSGCGSGSGKTVSPGTFSEAGSAAGAGVGPVGLSVSYPGMIVPSKIGPPFRDWQCGQLPESWNVSGWVVSPCMMVSPGRIIGSEEYDPEGYDSDGYDSDGYDSELN